MSVVTGIVNLLEDKVLILVQKALVWIFLLYRLVRCLMSRFNNKKYCVIAQSHPVGDVKMDVYKRVELNGVQSFEKIDTVDIQELIQSHYESSCLQNQLALLNSGAIQPRRGFFEDVSGYPKDLVELHQLYNDAKKGYYSGDAYKANPIPFEDFISQLTLAKEPAKEPVKEPAKEPVKEPAKEPGGNV